MLNCAENITFYAQPALEMYAKSLGWVFFIVLSPFIFGPEMGLMHFAAKITFYAQPALKMYLRMTSGGPPPPSL